MRVEGGSTSVAHSHSTQVDEPACARIHESHSSQVCLLEQLLVCQATTQDRQERSLGHSRQVGQSVTRLEEHFQRVVAHHNSAQCAQPRRV